MSELQSIDHAPETVPTALDLRSYVPKDLRPGLTAGVHLGLLRIGDGRCDQIQPDVLELSATADVPKYGKQNIRIAIRITGPLDAIVTVSPLFTNKPAKITPLPGGKLRFDLEPPVVITPVTMWFTERNAREGSKLGFDFTYGVPFAPFFWFDRA